MFFHGLDEFDITFDELNFDSATTEYVFSVPRTG